MIATPEGVQLALPLAGIGTRFMAILIDTLIGGTAALITILAAGVAGGEVAAEIASACSLLVWLIGYHVVLETFGSGRTIGKRAARIRVVMDGGGQVGLRASLIRNIIRLFEGFATTYLVAMLAILTTKNNQRLGDLAAGTLVIRDRRVVPPEPYIPDVSRETTLDATGIGDEELTLVRSFLARRDQLAPHARRTLAAELASKLRPRIAGVRAGLTDEGLLEQIAAAKGRR